jgi:hypothetical protein
MSSSRILEWQRQAAAEGAPGVPEDPTSSSSSNFTFENGTTLEALRQDQAQFASERDWDKFHTPRNVLLAMVGEVGELSEIFQWRGDDGCGPGLPQWSEVGLVGTLRHVIFAVVKTHQLLTAGVVQSV